MFRFPMFLKYIKDKTLLYKNILELNYLKTIILKLKIPTRA